MDGVQSSRRRGGGGAGGQSMGQRPGGNAYPMQAMPRPSLVAMQQAMDESRELHEQNLRMQFDEDMQAAMEKSRMEQFKKLADIRESERATQIENGASALEEYDKNDKVVNQEQLEKQEDVDKKEGQVPIDQVIASAQEERQAKPTISKYDNDRMDSLTVEDMIAMGIY